MSRYYADRAEFAHRAGVGEDDAVEQRPFDVGQGNAPKHLPAACAENQRGLFFAVALRLHQRDDFACDKGEGNEQRRQNNAGDGEDNLYALRFQPAAQCRVRAEQ